MKRSGDSTHHSPTPTLNDFDFTLSTGTQSSEQKYSYLTASKRHPSTPYSRNTPESFSRRTRPYIFPRSTKNVYTSLACSQDFLKILLENGNLFCSATAATKSALGITQHWFKYFRGILAYTLLGWLRKKMSW